MRHGGDGATQGNSRPWLVLVVLCLGTFAILLDSTIVNVALPSVITDLHAPLDQAIWVVNAYLLVFTALLILAGRLGDMFGPRRLFTGGLALFAVASALCGAAQAPGQLIAARVLQGIGAAALTPQAMVIIQGVFPRERMGAAFGVFSSMVGLAAVSGPTLGGVLTTYLSWRWVFYVNLPIAAVGITLAYAFVPEIRARTRRRLDPVGVLLASVGLATVVYGMIEGQRYSWGTVGYGITIPEIIGAGLAILIGFAAWERRYREPLVPPGLFRSRTFTIMVVLNLAVQFALQSMLLVNAINLQSVLGMTAVHAGLTGLPLTLALTAMAPFAGRLTDRIGGKYVLMAGLTVYALGIAGVAAVSSVRATSLTFAPALLVAGLGMGAIFAPLATMAMRAAPPAAPRAGPAGLRGRLRRGGQVGAADRPWPVRGQRAAGHSRAAGPAASPAHPRRLHPRLHHRHAPHAGHLGGDPARGRRGLPAAAPPPGRRRRRAAAGRPAIRSRSGAGHRGRRLTQAEQCGGARAVALGTARCPPHRRHRKGSS